MEHDTSDSIHSSSQNDRQVEAILNNPKFQELVRKKRTLSWSLAALMLFIYIGFILLVAYAPDFLHSSFNGATTWGIPLGIGVIISAFLLPSTLIKCQPNSVLTGVETCPTGSFFTAAAKSTTNSSGKIIHSIVNVLYNANSVYMPNEIYSNTLCHFHVSTYSHQYQE